MMTEIEEFFTRYNKLHGKEFRVKERVDGKAAGKLVKKGIAAFDDA